MAINWSNIEGFREDMTAEERISLLEAREDYGFIDPAATKNLNYKAQFDKASSELAAVKRQLKERMSEDEQKAAEREAADKALRDEVEELRRERTINQHKAELIAQGYDDKSATEFATSLVNGDMSAMFKTMKTVQGDMEKRLRSEILRGTPTPPAGDPNSNPNESKNAGVRIAKELGRKAAEANKTASDIISKYL